MPEFYFPRKAENATQLCDFDPDIRASFGDCNGLHRNDTLKPGFTYDVSLDGRSSSRAVSTRSFWTVLIYGNWARKRTVP